MRKQHALSILLCLGILVCSTVFLAVFTTGCGEQAPEVRKEVPPSASENEENSSKRSEEPSEEVANPKLNKALDKISSLEPLKTEEGPIVAIVEYGRSEDMPWSTVNAIEHLDRGTYDEELKEYFLVVPKYNGTHLTVYSTALEKKGEEYELERTETLYENKDTPDDYGIIVNSNLPETSSDIEVTISYQGQEVSYHFTYDGKGDRPAVQFLPEND